MPTQETLGLLDRANRALFEAEQAIRREEGQSVNACMYRMRIDLNEIIQRYMANIPICSYRTIREQINN